MLNYGVDGEEQYIGRDAYGCSQVGDYDEPSPRGEEHTQLLSSVSGGLLRSGLSLQLISLVGMFIAYVAYGGMGAFVFDIYAGGDSVAVNTSFHLILSILTFFYILGAVYTSFFQVFMADNSKFSRGFRVGSKLLASAATLDVVAGSLRLTQYLYAYNFMTLKWWAKYQQTSSDWAMVHIGTLVHAVALGMYGLGFFYTEVYHDEGTNEQYGWLCMTLYSIAAAGGLLSVFGGIYTINSLFLLAALFVATNWAFVFEPLVNQFSPPLHTRDLNSDIMHDPGHQQMEMTNNQMQMQAPEYMTPYVGYQGHEETTNPQMNAMSYGGGYEQTPYRQF